MTPLPTLTAQTPAPPHLRWERSAAARRLPTAAALSEREVGGGRAAPLGTRVAVGGASLQPAAGLGRERRGGG